MGRKRNLHNIYNPKKSNVQFSEGQKSKGILDDFALRKVINSQEGTIEKTPTENNDIVNKKYVDDENANYVPYTGATADVDLGAKDLIADDIRINGIIRDDINLDMYPNNQVTRGLRIYDGDSNIHLQGLGTSTLEFEDNVDLNSNDLTTTGDIDVGAIKGDSTIEVSGANFIVDDDGNLSMGTSWSQFTISRDSSAQHHTNVGIGTAPDTEFTLKLSQNFYCKSFTVQNGQAMWLDGGSSAYFRHNTTTNTIEFYHGGAHRLDIDTNGNVGIGTATPAEQLEVSGATILDGDVQVSGANLLVDGEMKGSRVVIQGGSTASLAHDALPNYMRGAGGVLQSATLGNVMPRDGSVVGMGVSFNVAACTQAGAIRCNLKRNGTTIFQIEKSVNSTGDKSDYDTVARNTLFKTFSAGDILSFEVDCDDDFEGIVINFQFIAELQFDT